ncbi:protein D1 [Bemisia tabaci]|uniref:protein D1 n=1 Tax=Bemisia tabaci TaxID=7038 RepID=UPI003B27DF29
MAIKIPKRTPEEIRVAMIRHGLVPQMIEKAPEHAVEVAYGEKIVDFGNNLTDVDMKNEPTHVNWPAEKDSLYTLMLIGPDVPTYEHPDDKECQHWIVANIRGNDIKTGYHLSEYVGLIPFYEYGPHRLFFLVFKQALKDVPLKFEEDEYRPKRIIGYMRGFFEFKPFAAKYRLGEPIAANFFLVQINPYPFNLTNFPVDSDGLSSRFKPYVNLTN